VFERVGSDRDLLGALFGAGAGQQAESFRGGTGLEPVVRLQHLVQAGDPARQSAWREGHPASDRGVRQAGCEQPQQFSLFPVQDDDPR
jgi:hypothetical protein